METLDEALQAIKKFSFIALETSIANHTYRILDGVRGGECPNCGQPMTGSRCDTCSG